MPVQQGAGLINMDIRLPKEEYLMCVKKIMVNMIKRAHFLGKRRCIVYPCKDLSMK